MTNNNADNVNKENSPSLLSYSEETSADELTRASAEVSEATPQTGAAVQFASRRERRMSETSMMRQITPEEVKSNAPAYYPSKVESSTALPAVPAVPSLTLPPAKPAGRRKVNSSAPVGQFKEYWGGTAMLMSLTVFLIAQLIFAVALVGYIILNQDLMSDLQSGTRSIEEITTATPVILLLGNFMMYAAWTGNMWWVTKYRSGVQRGKKFWAAAKDNFRLRNFKYIDILYGLGIAVVLIGLQTLVLEVLPQFVPSFKPIVEAANNTNQFAAMDDVPFYLIAFGMGAIVGPIFEELFFRGFLLRGFTNHFSYKNSGRNLDVLEDELGNKVMSLKSMMVSYRAFTHKHRYVLAIIATSILFGLVHFQGSWLTCVITGLLGVALAITTIKLNRIYPAIFGHIFHNAIALLFVALNR